ALLACNPRASLVSLGSSILRTETAGIVAPALVLHELGRMMHDAREAQERTSAHVESRREEAGDACEAGGQS
ncbi:MAG: RNA methyltransferase, partial [Eggerthella sp.]|nr:RNA methyltransferase [Eggerthella sp.]